MEDYPDNIALSIPVWRLKELAAAYKYALAHGYIEGERDEGSTKTEK